jgi:hypothetical protein
MASRTGKSTATTKAPRPARKTAAPRTAGRKAAPKVPAVEAEKADATEEESASGARALIRAGLKALGDVRGDMVSRQSRIFEVLLGIGQSPAWKASAKAAAKPAPADDPFGKFEDVFDERVARSLERLGMPSPQALRELTEQVRELNELLRSAAKPKAPRRR